MAEEGKSPVLEAIERAKDADGRPPPPRGIVRQLTCRTCAAAHHAGMTKTHTKTVDEATKRELAVRAEVDPRTIEKILRGEPVRGMAGRRARRTLEGAGLIPADTSNATGGQR